MANSLPSVAVVDAQIVKASIEWYMNEVDRSDDGRSDESLAVKQILERLQSAVGKQEQRAPLSFAEIVQSRKKCS